MLVWPWVWGPTPGGALLLVQGLLLREGHQLAFNMKPPLEMRCSASRAVTSRLCHACCAMPCTMRPLPDGLQGRPLPAHHTRAAVMPCVMPRVMPAHQLVPPQSDPAVNFASVDGANPELFPSIYAYSTDSDAVKQHVYAVLSHLDRVR